MQELWYEQGGELYKLQVPITVDQIRFDDFCDFQAEERKYINICSPPDIEEDNSNKEEVDSWEFPVDEAMKQLTIAVRVIIKGDIVNIPFSLDGENTTKLVDGGYSIKTGDDLSIIRMYAHIITMIRAYKPSRIPETFSLRFKGLLFRLTRKSAITMLTGKALTIGEAVEVLEYQRRFAENIKNKPLEVGNLDFTLGLSEFAILVRKKGERLPWDRSLLNKFIEDRRKFFMDLPLSDVLSLRFFLLNALLIYAKIPITNSFGKVNRPRVKHISRRQRKRRKR